MANEIENVNTGTEQVGAVQSQEQVTQVTQPTQVETKTETTTSTPLEIEIEGIGKVTQDQIKEWKLGNMRQADYTRKTQEIAKQKQEAKEAMELYDYLRANPQIAQAIANGDTKSVQGDPMLSKLNPVTKQVEDMQFQLATMQIDNEISRLKKDNPDFNEVEVLTEAERLGITDLEFVYNALKGKSVSTMKEDITKQVRAQIMAELQNNKDSTSTIINTIDSVAQTDSGLSAEEKNIAQKMGISLEDYAKGK